MNELTFTLKQRLAERLNVASLTPDKLAGKSVKDIKAINLPYGMSTATVGDLFQVTGKVTSAIAFARGSDKLDYVGSGMRDGTLTVNGPCGDFVGAALKGGQIEVKGDVGNWCGTGMSSGQIEIQGNAGDGLGGAYPGDQSGMKGGAILITGSAGDRVAERMRRGIMVIMGDCGQLAGANMLAGTLIVLGMVGPGTGFGMKRGTIVLGTLPAAMAPTFNRCGEFELDFLLLVFKYVSELSKRFKIFSDYGSFVERFAGDLAATGRGEILILQ